MKERLLHLPSTIPGLFLLVFLLAVVIRRPDLLDRPDVLIGLAGGLYGLLAKPARRRMPHVTPQEPTDGK